MKLVTFKPKSMKPQLKQMNKSRGKLIYIVNGNTHVIAFNKPFGVLENLKQELQGTVGYQMGQFKITYC